jgi:hypothetical protein
MMGMQAPFPWFGGKSRAAPLAWAAMGKDVGGARGSLRPACMRKNFAQLARAALVMLWM